MTRCRTIIAAALVPVVLGSTACGHERRDHPPPESGSEQRGPGTGQQGSGALPEELLECFADKGYDIESSAEIHSAPPQVVQACFESLHQGGASP